MNGRRMPSREARLTERVLRGESVLSIQSKAGRMPHSDRFLRETD